MDKDGIMVVVFWPKYRVKQSIKTILAHGMTTPTGGSRIMNEDKDKRAYVFLIIQSLLCFLLAVMLIAAVMGIYRAGVAVQAENPLAAIFSREVVAEHARLIVPLFFAVIGSSIAGLILGAKDENGLGPVKGGKVENKAYEGNTIRRLLLVAAVALIIAGVFNGSALDVFGKAVKICTECVGLG